MSDVEPDVTEIDESDFKEMRKKANSADKLAGENAQLARRATFAEAGIPTNGKIATLFRESYKGDLDSAAVTAAWTELQGEIGGTPAEPVDHQAQVDDMAQSRGGGEVVNPDDEPAPDKRKAAWEAYLGQRAQGRSAGAASAEISSRIIDAGIKGEQWAQVQPWTEEQLRQARTQIG